MEDWPELDPGLFQTATPFDKPRHVPEMANTDKAAHHGLPYIDDFSLSEFAQQRSSFDKINRIKAFRIPIEYWSEKCARITPPPLTIPKMGKAHRAAQLP